MREFITAEERAELKSGLQYLAKEAGIGGALKSFGGAVKDKVVNRFRNGPPPIKNGGAAPTPKVDGKGAPTNEPIEPGAGKDPTSPASTNDSNTPAPETSASVDQAQPSAKELWYQSPAAQMGMQALPAVAANAMSGRSQAKADREEKVNQLAHIDMGSGLPKAAGLGSVAKSALNTTARGAKKGGKVVGDAAAKTVGALGIIGAGAAALTGHKTSERIKDDELVAKGKPAKSANPLGTNPFAKDVNDRDIE